MTMDSRIRTKSVYTEIEPGLDGLRLLVARFRGRGLPSDRYDVWMPNLGPSERLLKQYLSGALTWPDFRRAYKTELFESGDTDRANQIIKNKGQKFTLRLIQRLAESANITLLCHCGEDETRCHRHVLRQILQGKI